MGWFRKKKKHTETIRVGVKPTPKNPDNNTISEDIKGEITSKKRDAYVIPSIDRADFTKEGVKKERLVRATGHTCPECSNILFNTRLDGLHYYCPECNRQYHRKEIKK